MMTTALGSVSRMRSSTSSPSMRAIFTSSSVRSGRSSVNRLSASPPPPAVFTSCPSYSRICWRILRMPSSSSTTRIRAMSLLVGPGGRLCEQDERITLQTRGSYAGWEWERERVFRQTGLILAAEPLERARHEPLRQWNSRGPDLLDGQSYSAVIEWQERAAHCDLGGVGKESRRVPQLLDRRQVIDGYARGDLDLAVLYHHARRIDESRQDLHEAIHEKALQL